MLKYAAACTILAWGEVLEAAIFAVPEPTFVTPAVDGWNPAPTRAPRLGAIELLKRDEPWEAFMSSGTCGFFDGASTSAYTCKQSSHVCATNTYHGNQGCCDPYEPAESCTVVTTCMPKSILSKSCDSDCSKDDFIAKCTASANPECYELQFVYTLGARTTTMKEYGCTDTAITTTLPVTPHGYSAPGSGDTTSSSSSSTLSMDSPTPTPTPQQVTKGDAHPNNTPAIIGGVIGGLALLSALIFAIVFLILRDRRRKREALSLVPQQHHDWPASAPAPPPLIPGMAEVHYTPDGFVGCNVYADEPHTAVTDDGTFVATPNTSNWKAWGRVNRDKKGPQERVTSCGDDGLYGPGEIQGTQIHEAPS
ncbi:hypothetical protein BU23DRAFT_237509 [Bimuria novae-zelandiae CBS 107.79]|uniref:Mid2 domain-containing protein n=1 Tax=Bimuria novae-zelandiae CBS 107.79 TaxID=1447943 RepID=A0A6A5V0K7_9PLEO|nr:hypothetical protein BU23DRAFT_237509 [Bimuria novae-zelandiae CBS 107.79]